MPIKKKVAKNTTIEKNKNKVQEGDPIEKVNHLASNVVGLSVGVTLNLGDFQSLRVDCWLSQEVQPGENRQKILTQLTDEIQEHINYVTEEFQE